MMYFLAIFVPPIYFLVKKRWMAFAMTFALLIVSIFLLAMLFLAPIVLVIWALCAGLAIWDLRKGVASESPQSRS